jgi:hypothetical protein
MKVFVNHCVRDRSGVPATEYRLIAARIFAKKNVSRRCRFSNIAPHSLSHRADRTDVTNLESCRLSAAYARRTFGETP